VIIILIKIPRRKFSKSLNILTFSLLNNALTFLQVALYGNNKRTRTFTIFPSPKPFPVVLMLYINICLFVFLSFKMLKRIMTIFWSAVEVKDKTSEILGRDCLFSGLKVLQQWNYSLMVQMFAFHNWSSHERSRDSIMINWKSAPKSKDKNLKF